MSVRFKIWYFLINGNFIRYIRKQLGKKGIRLVVIVAKFFKKEEEKSSTLSFF